MKDEVGFIAHARLSVARGWVRTLVGLILVGAAFDLPAATPPVIEAGSAIVLDARTGRVLYEKNADVRRPVASTQKLLTALLVIERGGLDRRMTIRPTDTEVEPTVIGLRSGQSFTRQQLVGALIVKSGNDVAKALARDHSGSSAAFAIAMNKRAREIGMRNSNFVTPNGLPAKGQFSTARDLGRLAMVAYRNPVIRHFSKIQKLAFTFPSGTTKILQNTNKLLSRDPLVNGLKTGYTRSSGYCLVSSARHGEREVISVVLGSPVSTWAQSAALLRYGLSRVQLVPR